MLIQSNSVIPINCKKKKKKKKVSKKQGWYKEEKNENEREG